MLVVRYTWQFPSSCVDAAQQRLAQANQCASQALRGWRVYRSQAGAQNTLAVEWEFEGLAQWKAWAAQFFALPANKDHFPRWSELEPSSDTCQVWELADKG